MAAAEHASVLVQTAYAALPSFALDHLPNAAWLFIRARWAKAAWPLATFSALPLQAALRRGLQGAAIREGHVPGQIADAR